MARFNTEATKWGCQHEKVAKETYASFQKGKQKNFGMSYSGLFVSTDHPYLGASPDGLVCCDCCGAGACEIKVLICAWVKFLYGDDMLDFVVKIPDDFFNNVR